MLHMIYFELGQKKALVLFNNDTHFGGHRATTKKKEIKSEILNVQIHCNFVLFLRSLTIQYSTLYTIKNSLHLGHSVITMRQRLLLVPQCTLSAITVTYTHIH